MNTKGFQFLIRYMASEFIGFGVGIPVACIYGFALFPLFEKFDPNFGQYMLTYAGIVGVFVVTFMAVPTNIVLSTGIMRYLNRFEMTPKQPDNLKYYRKISRLPFVHGLFIFLRIFLGIIIVSYLLMVNLKTDIQTMLNFILLGTNGAFIAGAIAYIVVHSIVKPILLDIIATNTLSRKTIMKKKIFGLSISFRFFVFILTPIIVETLTLVSTFISISQLKMEFTHFLGNLIAIAVVNLLVIGVIGIVWQKRTTDSVRSIMLSMQGFLSEKGDLTQKIPTTLDDEIHYISFLYNNISQNISNMIFDAKDKSRDVSQMINEIFEPLYMVVSASASSYRAVERIKNNMDNQKQLTDLSIQNTENMQTNIDTLNKFALDFSNALKNLVEKVDGMVEMLMKLKDNSRESFTTIESGIRSVTSTENYLSVISEATEGVKRTASEIDKIVAVIEDIANQTNMLSMNASIEASHVGQYGKGFAVVAKEIKKLADQSREGAKDTTMQVKKLIESVENSSLTSESAIKEIKSNLDVFQRVKEFYNNLNLFLEDQSKIASILKVEIAGISNKMKQLINLVEEQNHFVVKTNENSHQIKSNTDDIHSQIDGLLSKIDTLVQNVHTSIEVLKDTQKVDEDLVNKFEEFKIHQENDDNNSAIQEDEE